MTETPTETKPKLVMPVVCYSRVVGYLSPVNHWNAGKAQEWQERRVYDIKAMEKVLDTKGKA